MVTFDCNNYGYGNRTGYAPDVNLPIQCELVDPTDASQGVQWNSTDLPTCIGMFYFPFDILIPLMEHPIFCIDLTITA